MATIPTNESFTHSLLAKRPLFSVGGDPFLIATWGPVLFLHFLIEPEALRAEIPRPFELELYDGVACVSLVAVTMSQFRPCRRVTPLWLFACLRQQRFLNFRTYVRGNDQPGAFFLWGWLSAPLPIRLPSNPFSTPYSFASVDYKHNHKENSFIGSVSTRVGEGELIFRATIPSSAVFHPCAFGSLDEFALERYTGFFCAGARAWYFRVWHPPWQQITLHPQIQAMSLISNRFPWFREARLARGNFSPGFSSVGLGRHHRLGTRVQRNRARALAVFLKCHDCARQPASGSK